MKTLKVISKKHPYTRYTEGHKSLIDFVKALKEKEELLVTFQRASNPKPFKDSNVLLCVEDNFHPYSIFATCSNLLAAGSTLILFFNTRTKRYGSEEFSVLKNLLEKFLVKDNFYVVVPDKALVGQDYPEHKVLITDCLYDQTKSFQGDFDLVFLDLADDQVEQSKIFQEQIRPFISGHAKAKKPMVIYSNIGISSMSASMETLRANNVELKGLTTNSDVLEQSIALCHRFVVPSSRERIFNRWVHIANKNNKDVLTDHPHGCLNYQGDSLFGEVSKIDLQ